MNGRSLFLGFCLLVVGCDSYSNQTRDATVHHDAVVVSDEPPLPSDAAKVDAAAADASMDARTDIGR